MTNVLAAKRKLKVLNRTPEHERDDVWRQEVARLQQWIEETVAQTTASAPRQGSAREEDERRRQEEETRRVVAAGGVPDAPVSTPVPKPSAAKMEREASVRPESAAGETVKEKPVPAGSSALALLSTSATVYRDIASRPAFGATPFLASLVRAPPPLLLLLHLCLMAYYVRSVLSVCGRERVGLKDAVVLTAGFKREKKMMIFCCCKLIRAYKK